MSKEDKRNKRFMHVTIGVMIACFSAVTVLIEGAIVYVLAHYGVITNLLSALIICFVINFLVALLMIWMLGRIPLRPVEILVERMERLTRGDYKVRITVSDNPNQYSNMKKIADGFNMLAEELENTEMLRQDFVNNFSHEFKTPINSIAGFAKLMKKKKLTDEQKEEYLSIIEEESLRLSSMATKVLNLTKVENQRILSGIDLCNVSEQLRKTILLSQNRWTEKNLKFEINFEEHFCEGNEELLKQVWINLIDNAIKFSPNDGRVSLDIKEKPECIEIIIANQGEEFTEEMKKHVFRKFYQGDQSHASEGNGIGLAIVKRVLELHHGSVVVSCANGMIIFNVKLPKKQKSFD